MSVKKIERITDEDWLGVCQFNRDLLADFIQNSPELSPKTLKVYKSNLKVWFIWLKSNLGNKRHVDVRPIDFKRFQNWLVWRGCSSSDCDSKRAVISSLNNYIEVYLDAEFPSFRNFINKSIARPPKTTVYEKSPLTRSELDSLIATLKERGETQKVAYLLFTFESGCRREESRQLLREVVNYRPHEQTSEDGDGRPTSTKYYLTHTIRCKGRGNAGKPRKLAFGERAMEALKAWAEERGEDGCPYMFVTSYNGEIRQASATSFNRWCETFAEIVGRRFHPHSIRGSRATQLVVEDGYDISKAQKLLGHESASTTEGYVRRNEVDDFADVFRKG